MPILDQLEILKDSLIERQQLKDEVILFRIRDTMRCEPLTALMDTLTVIGTGGAVWLAVGLNEMRHQSSRLNGLTVCSVVAFNVITNNLLTKVFFDRVRPCRVYPHEYMRDSLPMGSSFPSGHTLTSFSAMTVLALGNPATILWALPLAAGISFSRLYLFAHWPSDVCFGALEGIITGVAFDKMFKEWAEEGSIPLLDACLTYKTPSDKKQIREEEDYQMKMGESLSDKKRRRKRQLDRYHARIDDERRQKEEAVRLEKEKRSYRRKERIFNAVKAVEIAKVLLS